MSSIGQWVAQLTMLAEGCRNRILLRSLLSHYRPLIQGNHYQIGSERTMRPISILLIMMMSAMSALTANEPAKKEAPKSVGGIGAFLGVVGEKLTVLKVLPGTPASEAGLTEKLVILSIDGVSTAGKSQEICGAMVRGLPGTKVILDLYDPGRGKTITVELTRKWIR